MSLIAFMILAPLVIVSAIAVILFRNPIASALALVVTLSTIAVFYFLLEAPFVGVLQILVYAGAIMVLFIFVIMLINLKDDELEPVTWSLGRMIQTITLGAATLGLSIFLFRLGSDSFKLQPLPKAFGSIQAVGQSLFTTYTLPFELVSFVILAAIIGAVLLARRGDPS